MLVYAGVILILIGLVASVILISYAYKEFKKDESNPLKKFFFLILEILDISSGLSSPTSFISFGLILSLGAVLIGFDNYRGISLIH